MVTVQEDNKSTSDDAAQQADNTKLIGLMAQFDDPDSLLHACDNARQYGYKKMDAFSPFPVHGIDDAIGIRRTILPFIVLAIGIGGCLFALGLQYYANGTDSIRPFPGYKFIISGKPFFSWPANIPVTFEIVVLSSAFAAFFGMLVMNGLPKFANPLHRISRFKRASNDRFFLVVEVADEKFSDEQTRSQFDEWGATGIEEVREDLSDHTIPPVIKKVLMLLAFLLILPPAMIYKARGMTSRSPRLHVVPDMDWQYRYKAQNVGPNFGSEKEPQYLFQDMRVMRQPIAGTVARGELENDSEFFRGIKQGSAVTQSNAWVGPPSSLQDEQNQEEAKSPADEADADAKQDEEPTTPAAPEPDWVTEFPELFKIERETMERGRERYNIYCVACHGHAGDGDGLVNKRAMELNLAGKATWTQAKAYHDPEVMKQPVGRLFDTITNGRGTMGPYGSQITAEDRWAIVLYIKALQATRVNEEKPPVDPEENPGEAAEEAEGNAEPEAKQPSDDSEKSAESNDKNNSDNSKN